MRKHKISAMLFGTMLFCSICMSGCGEENTASNQQESQSQKETDKLDSENDLEESKSGFCNLKQFTAKTLDQQDFTKEDIASKDVTVLNFWSLLCGPCIQEMPEIAKFAKSLPENVQVLTVCLDGAEEIDYTQSILEKAGFDGITLLQGDGDFGKMCSQVQYTPTTLFLDKDGNVVGKPIIGGQRNLAETYTEAINQVLSVAGKGELPVDGK